ncbi:MAG: hypothetical protein GY679_01450 [Mycoplasma sp.]|nr:hypothetical protein [Mycoplasma sp.]
MLVKNKKNKEVYSVIDDETINATNELEGQKMVTYIKGEQMYVREYSEFWEKFEII